MGQSPHGSLPPRHTPTLRALSVNTLTGQWYLTDKRPPLYNDHLSIKTTCPKSY